MLNYIILILSLILSCKSENKFKMLNSDLKNKEEQLDIINIDEEKNISIPRNLNELRNSASPYEYAFLSYHTYENNFKEGL